MRYFEHQVRDSLTVLLADQASRVVIDSTRVLNGEAGQVVMVSYHIEGALHSPAQFTFPFAEEIPLAENVAAFLDYGHRSWASAYIAPGTISVGRSAGA